MDTRQDLVDQWRAKLTELAQDRADDDGRLVWLRRIYARVYRFLISCYGDGGWREDDDSRVETAVDSNASRMPLVESHVTLDGLSPKSPERIRSALEAIHAGNPGLAVAGTSAIADETWVVVFAGKKSKSSREVRRRLVRCGIDACVQNRATDTAVLVRHAEFDRAMEVLQHEERSKKLRITKRVDAKRAVGFVLLILSVLTFLALTLMGNSPLNALLPLVFFLWIIGLAAGWRCAGRRTRR